MNKLPANLIAALFALACIDAGAADPVKTACVRGAPAQTGMPNRISMNVTVPKQTQGATFGEKVNQGLHAAGGAVAQGARPTSGGATDCDETDAMALKDKTGPSDASAGAAAPAKK